ncbi:MAG TPA: portal protein, partial [Rhabdochlamydiaceae bacterium]
FEMKSAEILTMRLESLGAITPYIGKFFSAGWVQKNILMMTEDEVDDMKEEIDKEIEDGLYPDPTMGAMAVPGADPNDPTKPGTTPAASANINAPANLGDYGVPKNRKNPQDSLKSKDDLNPDENKAPDGMTVGLSTRAK